MKKKVNPLDVFFSSMVLLRRAERKKGRTLTQAEKDELVERVTYYNILFDEITDQSEQKSNSKHVINQEDSRQA